MLLTVVLSVTTGALDGELTGTDVVNNGAKALLIGATFGTVTVTGWGLGTDVTDCTVVVVVVVELIDDVRFAPAVVVAFVDSAEVVLELCDDDDVEDWVLAGFA